MQRILECRGGDSYEMKRQESDRYRSYLLRVWKECQASESLWRASLESAQTGELRNFTDLEALVEFLRGETLPKRRIE